MNLNHLASILYAGLYSEWDDVPEDKLYFEFLQIPEERRDGYKNVVLWLRDHDVDRDNLPEFYARMWSTPSTSPADYEELLSEGRAIEDEEVYFRVIRRVKELISEPEKTH